MNRVFDEATINGEKSIQEAVDIRLLTDSSSNQRGRPGKANLNIGNQVNLKVLINIYCVYKKISQKNGKFRGF